LINVTKLVCQDQQVHTVTAAQEQAQLFILVILEFIRTLILEHDFQLLDILLSLMEMELLIAMDMELTLPQQPQALHTV
jgi:hypothetical protein